MTDLHDLKNLVSTDPESLRDSISELAEYVAGLEHRLGRAVETGVTAIEQRLDRIEAFVHHHEIDDAGAPISVIALRDNNLPTPPTPDDAVDTTIAGRVRALEVRLFGDQDAIAKWKRAFETFVAPRGPQPPTGLVPQMEARLESLSRGLGEIRGFLGSVNIGGAPLNGIEIATKAWVDNQQQTLAAALRDEIKKAITKFADSPTLKAIGEDAGKLKDQLGVITDFVWQVVHQVNEYTAPMYARELDAASVSWAASTVASAVVRSVDEAKRPSRRAILGRAVRDFISGGRQE